MKFRTIEISDPEFEPKGFRYITVKSAALKCRADVSVFIPEQAKGKSNIPVIVLLHGVYGSHWSWTMQGNAHQTLQNMIIRGDARPFVLVMPSDGLWGDGSGYVPHAVQNFEKWIGEELPSLIRQTIEGVTEASDFFISGLSMGGYGAFRIGLKYSANFQGISAHSSIINMEQLKKIVEEDWSFWDKEDTGSIEKMILSSDHIPDIRFDCGLDDDLLIPNRDLHGFLTKHQIKHQYQEFPGGHEWNYWREKVKETFLFFSNLNVR